MRNFLVTLIIFLTAASAQAESRQHFLVVSIDGLRPEIYLDPERSGVKVPNLIALRNRGVYAEGVVGVMPTVTYPSHTTLVTGVLPDRHGVTGNFLPGTLEWRRNASDIHSRTLWQAAKQAGLSTAIVTWPLSVGADVDWLVPEIHADGEADLSDFLRRHATPGLFDELERKAGKFPMQGTPQDNRAQVLDAMSAHYAARLLLEKKPNLTLVHLLEGDAAQHHFGPHSAEARAAFERIDAHIGRLLAALTTAGIAADTNVIVVGDHGFVDSHTAIEVGAILRDSGYSAEQLPVQFESQGGSGAFFPKAGRSADDIDAFSERLRNHIATRYRSLLTFLSMQDLRDLGGYPGAVAGLAAAPGYMLVARSGSQSTLPMRIYRGMHGYHPDLPGMSTGFIASGPRLLAGKRLGSLRLLDIAATLAALLEVELPAAQGVVIAGALRPLPGEPAAF